MAQRNTQDRWRASLVDIKGFYSYLFDESGQDATQFLQRHGFDFFESMEFMEYQNQRDNNPDPISGNTCLYINDISSVNPVAAMSYDAEDLTKMLLNGFEILVVTRIDQRNTTSLYSGSCLWSLGWLAEDDPRTGSNVRGRLLLTGSCDSNTSTNPTEQGFSLYQAAPVIFGSIPWDGNFAVVRVVVSPSPDGGVSWGGAELFINDVSQGTLVNWVNTGVATTASNIKLESGSEAGQGRRSKHIAYQIRIYQDNRTFELLKEGFDINVIGGVIGLEPTTVNIPATAADAEGCSIVEMQLLENTPITLNVTSGNIRYKTTDPASSTLTINPTGTEGIRGIYIVKDSDVGVLPQEYLVIPLTDVD